MASVVVLVGAVVGVVLLIGGTDGGITMSGSVLVFGGRDAQCNNPPSEDDPSSPKFGINQEVFGTAYAAPGSTIIVTGDGNEVLGTGHLLPGSTNSGGGCDIPFKVRLSHRAETYSFSIDNVDQGQTLLDSDLRSKKYKGVNILAASSNGQ